MENATCMAMGRFIYWAPLAMTHCFQMKTDEELAALIKRTGISKQGKEHKLRGTVRHEGALLAGVSPQLECEVIHFTVRTPRGGLMSTMGNSRNIYLASLRQPRSKGAVFTSICVAHDPPYGM